MPLARVALYESGVEIYIASTADDGDEWQATLVHIARESRAYVISPCHFQRASSYPDDFPLASELEGAGMLGRGGSAILAPDGSYLAGPLYERGGHPLRRARPGGAARRAAALRPGRPLQPAGRARAQRSRARCDAEYTSFRAIRPFLIGKTSTPSHSSLLPVLLDVQRPLAHREVLARVHAARAERHAGIVLRRSRSMCSRTASAPSARSSAVWLSKTISGWCSAWIVVEVLPVPRVVVAADQLGDLSGVHAEVSHVGAARARRRCGASGRRRRSARAGAARSCGRRRAGRGSGRARSGPRPRARRRAPRAPARTPRPRPRSRRRRGRAGPAPRGSGRAPRRRPCTGSSPSSASSARGRLRARAELGASRPGGRASRRAARARGAARPSAAHGSGGGAMPGSSGSAPASARVELRAQLVEPRAREDPAAGALDAGRARRDARATPRAPARARSPRSRRARRAPCARRSRAAAAPGRSRVPPPTVVSARSTTRSPRAATTGSASRSCAKRSPTRTTRASDARRAVVDVHARRDLGERRRARRRGGSSADTRRARRARRRAGARCRSTPGSATATRWPASARVDRRGRAPARCARAPVAPPGSARSSSPSPIEPDQSVPVATVPIPRSVKTRST